MHYGMWLLHDLRSTGDVSDLHVPLHTSPKARLAQLGIHGGAHTHTQAWQELMRRVVVMG